MSTSSPTAKKLQIRPGATVALVNAPTGIAEQLSPLPDGAVWVAGEGVRADVVLLFAWNSTDLDKLTAQAFRQLAPEGILWVAYPKGTAKVATDLTRDRGWTPLQAAGYEAVAQVAVDAPWSALRFRPVKHDGDEARVAAQYAGGKAALLPIYARVVEVVRALGPDVTLQPRQSYVAFARTDQFALAKPGKERIELALKLANAPSGPRLEAAPGVGSGSMTHRVVLQRVEDVDAAVAAWLAAAYRAAA